MKIALSIIAVLLFAYPQQTDKGIVVPEVQKKIHYDKTLTCPKGYDTAYLSTRAMSAAYWISTTNATTPDNSPEFWTVCITPEFIKQVKAANDQVR